MVRSKVINRVSGWMDVWMDGWMDGWMEWMDGWFDVKAVLRIGYSNQKMPCNHIPTVLTKCIL
jgi:hypothetical protein